jgi:hypothetical protein
MFGTSHGQAHADADSYKTAKHPERLLHVLEDSGGDCFEVVEIEDVFNQDGELISGES